jgi:hypothetical protein
VSDALRDGDVVLVPRDARSVYRHHLRQKTLATRNRSSQCSQLLLPLLHVCVAICYGKCYKPEIIQNYW